MSGYKEEVMLEHGFDRRGAAFLPKPFRAAASPWPGTSFPSSCHVTPHGFSGPTWQGG